VKLPEELTPSQSLPQITSPNPHSPYHLNLNLIPNPMNPVVHFELPSQNQNRMKEFYARVFGWQTEELGPEMNNYILVTTTENGDNGMPKNPGAINGGFYEKTNGMPNHPSIVVAVTDIHASIQKVKDHGGTVKGKPDMIPGVGLFVYIEDTEGNTTGMLQPEQMQ
jgi:uncharacterized protein